MIYDIPNVSRARHPALCGLVQKYASRYEYRLDGSSLWEGRVKDAFNENPSMPAQFQNPVAWATGKPMLSLEMPSSFTKMRSAHALVLGWFSRDDLAYIVTQATDLFVVQHTDCATYEWDLARVKELVGEGARVRDDVCDFGYAMEHAAFMDKAAKRAVMSL